MGHSEDLEEQRRFRPRMGKGGRARDRVAESSLGVGRLVRHGHGRRGPGRARRVVVQPAAPGFAPRRNARRVIIKAHVQYLARGGAQAAARHLRYIERDGVEKDGSPGVLYGPEGPALRQTFEEPRVGERHSYRFIVSPEDGHDLELTEYTRSVMQRVGRDLARRIEWAAVNHYDTDHPHAHVVVRGVDLDGGPLWMEPAYIARGMRWGAQELATDRLGPRLESEIQRTYEREVTQERLTSLDRELARRATSDRRIAVEAFEARRGYPQPETLGRRLEQLGRLGLAERRSETAWVLADGWQKALSDLGIRGDKLKQLHRAMNGANPARFHIVPPREGIPDGRGGIEQGVLVGRVASKEVEVTCDGSGRVSVRSGPEMDLEREELARRAAGAQLARATARTFLPEIPPGGFEGWIKRAPAGAAFVEVSDGLRFTLIPNSPEARARTGQTVLLVPDARGRCAGFRPPRERGRDDDDLGR